MPTSSRQAFEESAVSVSVDPGGVEEQARITSVVTVGVYLNV